METYVYHYLVPLRRKYPNKAITPKILFDRSVGDPNHIVGVWKAIGNHTKTPEPINQALVLKGSTQTYTFSDNMSPKSSSWYMKEFTLSPSEGQEWPGEEWKWAICTFWNKEPRKRKKKD